jgi:hypothetical protein
VIDPHGLARAFEATFGSLGRREGPLSFEMAPRSARLLRAA